MIPEALTPGAAALDSIAMTLSSISPIGPARELALLVLSVGACATVTAARPDLTELDIRQVADEMVRQVRLRVDRLDEVAGLSV